MSAGPTSALEYAMFHMGLFSYLCAFLPVVDIASLEAVNSHFNRSIRESEHFWRETASQVLKGKVFVPTVVTRMLAPKNKLSHRVDLFEFSVRELKRLAARYGLNVTKCFEKGDIVDVIHRREVRKKLPVECLARFALRVAVIDSRRNCIEESELCSFQWDIRVKADGPLGHMVRTDPWWRSRGCSSRSRSTTVSFYPDGRLTFAFNGPSPFRDMLESQPDATYGVERSGSVLLLSFGVREHVARHPRNWGWVLQSSGSVWASFVLPPYGSDPLLEDALVGRLVSENINHGFCL
jgi:hypothetical protein